MTDPSPILSKIEIFNENGKTDLSEMRVIQRNLVYVIGIPQKYANEEILKGKDFFGQFGAIKKLVVKNRTVNDSTVSAYITYTNENDAMNCIIEVDESLLDGKILKCTFGTTKYCSFFLKSTACQNIECMYLHEKGKDSDSFTKEEMLTGKGKFHNFKPLNKNKQRIGKTAEFDDMIKFLSKFKTNKIYRKPDKIYSDSDFF